MTKSNVIPFPGRHRKPATFKDFAEQVMSGNTAQAGHSLAQLFSLAPEVAERCATFFQKQVEENPDVLAELFNLRSLLISNQHNDAIEVVVKSFGLSHPDALVVVTFLLQSNAAGSAP